MSIVAQQIATELAQAWDTRNPIAPVRSRITGAQQAYEVQTALTKLWVARGRRIVGRKIGLTSKSVQKQIGVDEPDFGAIFEDMIVPDGSVIAANKVIQPRVEGELSFRISKDLAGDVSAEDVIEATEYVCASIEICDSRIKNWDIRLEDTLADNASSCLVVLGKNKLKPKLDELPKLKMKFIHNGEVVGQGSGADCLGNPANAVAWLAGALARFGAKLTAGDIVMSGALAPMISAKSGSRFEIDFENLDRVSVSFA